MSLVRFEPWSLLRSELDKLFEKQLMLDDSSTVETSQWIPFVDIKEKADRFVLLADIPGVDPKDIEVTMENNVLTVKGERSEEKKEERKGYIRTERSMGTFYRRFTLPDTADSEHISACGKHGVLEITIPKREKVLTRKINIKID